MSPTIYNDIQGKRNVVQRIVKTERKQYLKSETSKMFRATHEERGFGNINTRRTDWRQKDRGKQCINYWVGLSKQGLGEVTKTNKIY